MKNFQYISRSAKFRNDIGGGVFSRTGCPISSQMFAKEREK